MSGLFLLTLTTAGPPKPAGHGADPRGSAAGSTTRDSKHDRRSAAGLAGRGEAALQIDLKGTRLLGETGIGVCSVSPRWDFGSRWVHEVIGTRTEREVSLRRNRKWGLPRCARTRLVASSPGCCICLVGGCGVARVALPLRGSAETGSGTIFRGRADEK